ncbi:hypothetical protein GUITHDRAFT_150750 [Guillardia theta CCMP2712]|uniref:Uncharacterized protein n=1 Tax=Guillardia theta (strain CCMP2712) TaxID=905079 RepID=L1JVI2_GUITC|nr:hypothetical protein GUITHDRAFT_150750 [Guillardia theta CCMP2712]EKX52304.1 hypothetical protein GUITHDRAFT_150750 [Guillardia theta CCMP2712]|eukprot:XP_005839284.1 hypothetical protein GUITHDRAFT_150750 [Guillardia theta CCMP2712]
MMPKATMVMAMVVMMAMLVQARMPRNEEDRRKMEESLRAQRDNGVHVYYVLVKRPESGANTLERTREIAGKFQQRIAKDTHVAVHAASKDKIVVKVQGDEKLANEIVSAVEAFPEAGIVEKRPIYRTLGDQSRFGGGRRMGVPKPETATM